jgi:hypothetical protein
MIRWSRLPETSGAKTARTVQQPPVPAFVPFHSGITPADSILMPDATGSHPNSTGLMPADSGFNPDHSGFHPDTAGLKPDASGLSPAKPVSPENPDFSAISRIFSKKCTGEQKGGDSHGKRPNSARGG